MAPEALDELGAARDDARLGPAEELVAREADEVGAVGEALPRGGLVVELLQHTRAEIVDERQAVARRDLGELGDGRLGREADDAEVRLVDAKECSGLQPDRSLVIGGARAVRRPHLAQARARAREY